MMSGWRLSSGCVYGHRSRQGKRCEILQQGTKVHDGTVWCAESTKGHFVARWDLQRSHIRT
eukprot:1141976-Pelagomonas_calceolata.AAC.8